MCKLTLISYWSVVVDMSNFTIYHNPRCSKSRKTLDLLRSNNIEPQIILYLNDPPTDKEIAGLLKKLNISARDLLRKNEEAYKINGLSDKSISENDLISIMRTFPKLIERPIVVKGNTAVLGRPPENVNKLI